MIGSEEQIAQVSLTNQCGAKLDDTITIAMKLLNVQTQLKPKSKKNPEKP